MNVTPNKEGEFVGLYILHCPDERIEVEIGEWPDIFAHYEPWLPVFPPYFLKPRIEQAPDLASRSPIHYHIRFIGTPSKVEFFGYEDCCRRRVVIHRVLELREYEFSMG